VENLPNGDQMRLVGHLVVSSNSGYAGSSLKIIHSKAMRREFVVWQNFLLSPK